MYINEDETVFVTLALGDDYRHKVSTQLQSILKFTRHDAYVITDNPSYFGNYYGKRIHFIDFNGLTDMPLKGKQNMFNYNLKLVPLQYVFKHVKPAMAVWMDADSFLFGWNNLFFRAFDPKLHGIWGRFRGPLNEAKTQQLVKDKLEQMKVDATNIDTLLPIENVMFIKNGITIMPFLETWKKYADIAYSHGARTDFEAVEIALALYDTKAPYYNIENDQRYNIDDFRTLHLNNIHIPFIL